jgi:hypothetical protein
MDGLRFFGTAATRGAFSPFIFGALFFGSLFSLPFGLRATDDFGALLSELLGVAATSEGITARAKAKNSKRGFIISGNKC